jgi:competence protein ComEC
LLTGAVLLAVGCLLSDGRGSRAEVSVLVALAGLLLALAWRRPAGRGALWSLGAASLAFGAAAAQVESLQLRAVGLRRLIEARAVAGEEVEPLRLRGVVNGDTTERAGRLSLLLDVAAVETGGAWRPLAGRVRIEIAGEAPRPRLVDGDQVVLWAVVRPSEVEARDGICGYGFCKSARLAELTAHGETWFLRRFAGRLREAGRAAIVRAMAPGPERGLVLAMTLGDRSEIDDPTAETFRASGTYHVLALSGAQVALVAGLIVVLLRWLLASPWAQAIVTTAAIAFYALLVGGDVPVLRAVLMAAAVLVGRALERDSDAANLLGLTAAALLAQRPSCVSDVGFQLSFAATLGILLLLGPLGQGCPRLPLRAETAFLASLAAQLALTPILTASFHRLAPAALLLNIAAVPLSTAVLLSGLAVIAVAPLGCALSHAVAGLAWLAARGLRISADLGPLAPWLDVRVAAPGCGLLALYACGLALLRSGRRGVALGLLAAVHAVLVVGPLRPHADGRLHLTMLDVGQGDSLLLRSPSGRALLVDAGGSRDARFDPGERKVAPELWSRRVRTIDALLISHLHPDHAGGVPYLLRAFGVAEVWEGPAPIGDPGWRALQPLIVRSGATRRTLAAGMAIDWDGARLSVLGPRRPGRPPRAPNNDDSLVLDVAFGDVHLLLTGDVGGEAEQALAAGPAQVLKVAHHGSRRSTSPVLLAAVRPRLALVSAGSRNPFGDPQPEVLERCLRMGVLVLRTDRDGTIDVATDGRGLWVRTAGEDRERRVR